MPLTWNEIKARANVFVAEWRGETREAAERQSFWNDWFNIFGITRRRHVTFERSAERLSTGRPGSIDAFWPGMILIEHKSAGANLEATLDAQALDYLQGLSERDLPRLVIVSDFAHFLVLDMETNESVRFPLEDLPNRLDLFDFIAGYRRRSYSDEQDAANVKAAELMGQLYESLDESGYGGHDLRLLLVRLLFILFADDTGIWQRGIFQDLMELKTSEDGRDVGNLLDQLFQVLNTPDDHRQTTLDEDLQQFPYINGGLFADRINTPAFNTEMRRRLLECCAFDWSAISPAVFGSMFQSVLDPVQRRSIGAHYTTEQNIMKVLGPLFLDELKVELAALKRPSDIRKFQERLAAMQFLDPACGCGNFLMITFREMRTLELNAMKKLREAEGKAHQLALDARELIQVGMEQFHGIELEEFPARIAEVGMYLIDHLANQELMVEFGVTPVEFPISTTADIRIGNALHENWSDIIAPKDRHFLLGNPPFVGKQHRTASQKSDMNEAFAGVTGASVLDYVACWFAKAADWLTAGGGRVAFVSTNSIIQGEQVPILWPHILGKGLEIDFAHRTFDWSSEARHRAHVHVVIVGLRPLTTNRQKLLFDYETVHSAPREITATNINPYLVDAPNNIVKKRRRPLFKDAPIARYGNMPNDNGNLILSPDEYENLKTTDQVAIKYVRPLIGSNEMLSGEQRYCLWMPELPAGDLRASKFLRDRIAGTRKHREDSGRQATKVLAATPRLFGEVRQPTSTWLCLPRHTTQRREYVPLEFHDPFDIAHDSTLSVEGADTYDFAVLGSLMFNHWLRTVGGRIKSDPRISTELVYNTFPWPKPPSPATRQRISDAGQAILDARANLPGYTLEDMYDPDAMPQALRQAHRKADRLVQRLYTARTLTSDLQVQEVLFARYRELLST